MKVIIIIYYIYFQDSTMCTFTNTCVLLEALFYIHSGTPTFTAQIHITLSSIIHYNEKQTDCTMFRIMSWYMTLRCECCSYSSCKNGVSISS